MGVFNRIGPQGLRILALLAVLGLSGRERLALVMWESLALGLVGSLAGVALGTGLAALALRLLGGDLGGGFFAGVAGGLAAIHYEIVTSSVVGAAPSGAVLLMAYIGGIAFFIGPIIGAVLMTALQISLSDYTGAWLLYVGLMFVVVVMYAPWGLGGLLLMHVPLFKGGAWRRVVPSYALVALPALVPNANETDSGAVFMRSMMSVVIVSSLILCLTLDS